MDTHTKRAGIGGIMGSISAAGPIHITARRLITRLWLLTCDRPDGCETDLPWPAVVELAITSRERLGGDEFRRIFEVSKRRSEIERDIRGNPLKDENGKIRSVWVEGKEKAEDVPSFYGGLMRALAGRLGMAPKGLTEWSAAEVARIAVEVARKLRSLGGPEKGKPDTPKAKAARGKAAKRAAEFPDYPRGWREAYTSAITHGESLEKKDTSE